MNTWAKFALAVLVLAVFGIIAGTVWIAASVREETVVAHPYEEGLRHSEHAGRAPCDLADGPCTEPLDGGGEVTLEIGPRPLRTMQELSVRANVRSAPPDAAVTVAFAMDGMEMGRNEVRLVPTNVGGLAGTAVLVRCPSGRREWSAAVRIESPGVPVRTVRFRLAVRE